MAHLSLLAAGAPQQSTSQQAMQPPEQNQTSRLGASDAEAHCPRAGRPPVGLLFNHVSKTGGTTIKHYLKEVCGLVRFAPEDRHYGEGDKDLSSPDLNGQSPCVVQDDTKRLTVTAEELDSFFVLATVRRPCDYYLSLWAYLSARPNPREEWLWTWLWDVKYAQPFAGQHPPFDSDADREQFRRFLDALVQHDSYMLMGTQMTWQMQGKGFDDARAKRFADPTKVHCWVRTHMIEEDTRGCLRKFEQCGGVLNWTALDALDRNRFESSSHAWCSDFYNDTALQAEVMAREQRLLRNGGFPSLEELGVEQCCSSGPQAWMAE